MIIGNKTETPRAIPFGSSIQTIPPMGFITLEDTVENKAALEKLRATETFKRMLECNVLVINEQVNPYTAPVVPDAPKPPVELVAPPTNERVTKHPPKKTKETMRV